MSVKKLLKKISHAPVRDALNRLSNDERRYMLSLAIQKDSSQLIFFLREKGILSDVDIDDKSLYIDGDSDISHFINASFKFFSCSEEGSVELLRGAMRCVPDEIISVKWKSDFIHTFYSEISDKLSDLAYDESLPFLDAVQTKHTIDLRSYQQATATILSNSDYIMLSLSLLRTLTDGDEIIAIRLKEIEIDYFELDYKSAIQKILLISSALSERHPKAHASILKSLTLVSDVTQETNQTRRYFETKFSQYLLGETKNSEVIKSIDKISRSLINLGVSDPRTTEERIAAIAESAEGDVLERGFELESISPKYQTKDRAIRDGFTPRESESTEGEVSTEEVWSRNLGIMRGTDPNFRDEIAKGNLRNRVPDVNRARKEDPSDYFQNNDRHRSAYTSSISGHTFEMVAILEKYIIERIRMGENRKIINKDINNFWAAYIGTYAKRGYHSVHEVLDVLREPHIQRVFKNLGVKINPLIYDKSLANAMNDAAAYSQQICQKKSLQSEIIGVTKETAANKAQELLAFNNEKNKLISVIDSDDNLSGKARESLSRKIESCSNFKDLHAIKLNIIKDHIAARKDCQSLGFANADILSSSDSNKFSFTNVYNKNTHNHFWKKLTTNSDKRKRQLNELDGALRELVDADPDDRDEKLKNFYDKLKNTLSEVKAERNLFKSRLGDICEALIYSLEKTNPELRQEPEVHSSSSLKGK